MKFHEEHVFEVDMEGNFAFLDTESVEDTIGFVIYLLTPRYSSTRLAI
jgi:hypothetical protein